MHDYAAFISYRHLPRDQEVAKRVQKAIETFRLPHGIAPRSGARTLGKCFRDEDELPASHSLPERILDALRRSNALVVVCSPHTQESVWIQREITAFIEMHGRERVFAVLAEGSSAESIPELLRSRPADDGAGAGASASAPYPSNPLAADLRPEAAARSKDELLRLLAGIADCGYDELRQRNRARQRKQIALGAICAVCLVAIIAGALGYATNARTDALVAESQRLAGESSQLLAQGDRYGAIEKALEALPQSEASADRPVVAEAQAALEAALELGANPDSAWFASYEIRTDAPLGLVDASFSRPTEDENVPASAIAISETGGFFAISESNGAVSTYDTLTGRKLADCALPAEATPPEDGLYARSLAATEHYLLVANSSSDDTLTCFDAHSGEQIWSSTGSGLPAFDTSFGGDFVSMAFPLEDGGFAVAISDLATDAVNATEVTDAGKLPTNAGSFIVSGERLGATYTVFGNHLFATELDSIKSTSVELAYSTATSLAYLDGLVLAASASPLTSDAIERHFAVEAFDNTLESRWSYEGVFTSEMLVSNEVTSLIAAEPVIQGMLGDLVVVRVGREVLLLGANGSLAHQLAFEQSVLDAYPNQSKDEGSELLTISCSNGTVSVKDLQEGAQDAEGDGLRLALPSPLRWARAIECGNFEVVLAIPADALDRVVCYRTDGTREGLLAEDRSLDGLIALAHSVLEEGGRA